MKYSFKPITELLVQVLEHTGTLKPHIRAQLANYKRRWNESLATNLEVISDISEHTPGVPIILASYLADQLTSRIATPILLPTVGELTHQHLRAAVINPIVKHTTDIVQAKQWLESLPNVFAYDCETAKADGIEDIVKVKMALDVHRNQLTMYSFAATESESFVIINENQAMEDMVLNFLTSTTSKIVMHNASFDMKIIKHRTDKFCLNFEDTQIIWRCINNHTNTQKALTGLKYLAKHIYADWAVAPDLFGIEHKYNPDLIHYAGVDACATMYVYNEALAHSDFQGQPLPNDFPLIPATLLPQALPATAAPSRRYFYINVAKPLIPPTIDLMLQGLNLSTEAVANLATEIDSVLSTVASELASNPTIIKFQAEQYSKAKSTYVAEQKEKKRSIEYYTKPFDITKMDHRSYLMNYTDLSSPFLYRPAGILPTGESKWSIKDIKLAYEAEPESSFLHMVHTKTINPDAPTSLAAMRMLALTKTNLYNTKYEHNINNIPTDLLPPFNPGSSKQLTELFDYCKIPPLAFSKDTGAPSWGRDQVEEINHNTSNPDIKHFTKQFIDHSYSGIIKSNFLSAFERFSIDNVLYGEYKLGGAKTWRYTSNSPNMLNAPSSGSIYAKAFKKCIVPPTGFIVATADFAALEDRVLANLTNDKGKCAILEQGIDGHSYNAVGYFKDEISKHITLTGDALVDAQTFKAEVDNGNKALKELRQQSKAPTFKCAYGGFPDADKGGTITQEIFDNYHNVLYSGVKHYIDTYVVPTTQAAGELHLGLGWYIKSDNASRDSRTLHNATCQFWSILTTIALAKVHQRIQEDNMQEHIQCTSTIYDSVYYNCRAEPWVVDWLNKELVSAMSVDFLTNQRIPNSASLELGTNWSNLVEISQTASLEQIEITLQQLKEN